MPGYPCCCKGPTCSASFTASKGSGNTWTFTDTTPGAHTRSWSASNGASSTGSPWTTTFANDNVYSVTLTVTMTGTGLVCQSTQYVGGTKACTECVPNNVPKSVYVTVGMVGPGPFAHPSCDPIRLAIQGTWSVTDIFNQSCTWFQNYVLGKCIECQLGDFNDANHALTFNVYYEPQGTYPSYTGNRVVVSVGVGAGSNTDCNRHLSCYSSLYKTDVFEAYKCRGSWTANQVSFGTGFPDNLTRWCTWPASVQVIIP